MMSAQSNGLVASAQQNSAGGNSVRNVSQFPLSYSFYNTERFGEYTPFFVQEGVAGDVLPLHSSHEVRTYTLKAPLMQSLLKKKDFFAVPMSAILPLNWEKFYTNPVIGEDVPDDVGCGVVGFWSKVGELFQNSWNFLKTILAGSDTSVKKIESIIKFLVFFEYFYSTGSLMESLGISGHDYLRVTDTNANNGYYVFDNVFDDCFSLISANLQLSIDVGGDTYYVSNEVSKGALTANGLLWREALELIRDDLATFRVLQAYSTAGTAPAASVIDDIEEILQMQPISQGSSNTPYLMVPTGDEDIPLNLSRLWAYQLVCAHYYSNDHVDFVYSAELFRQYVNQLEISLDGIESFSVNGLSYQYDSLSSHYCSLFLGFSSHIFDFSSENFAYFSALLHYKRSLRYMDYFTGARSLPLAVGDTSVDASSGQVDVLDLSRSRMMAKFLQAVNRSGRKFGAYMKELFGKVPAPDYHNPFYLAHTSDVVGTSENQNTAEGQREPNAFTSNMHTNASRYAFEYRPDRDCIVIGLGYYDIPRVYTRATERQNFFVDRFDMFNPYLQFIGDQAIYRAEIGTDVPTLEPFGYQNRHMEYKQRYNQAAGAFANPQSTLDNWIFVADILKRQFVRNISSSFIRSFNSELDHFYERLSGWSNGSYFHFIVRYDNRQDATRPMAYAPVIA